MAKFYPGNIFPKASDFGRRIRKKGDEFVRKVLDSRNNSRFIRESFYGNAGDYPCIGPCIDENGNPVWINFTKNRIGVDDVGDAMVFFDRNIMNKPSHSRRTSIDDVRLDPLSYVDDDNVIVSNVARSILNGTEDDLSFGTKVQKIGNDGTIETRWTFNENSGIPQYSNDFLYYSYPDIRGNRPVTTSDFRTEEARKVSENGRIKPYKANGQWYPGSSLKGVAPSDLYFRLSDYNWNKYYGNNGRNRDRLEIPGATEYPFGDLADKTRFMLDAMEKADRHRVNRFQSTLPIERMNWKQVRKALDSAKVRKYDNFPKLFEHLYDFDSTPFDSKFSNPEYIQRMHERILKNKGGK